LQGNTSHQPRVAMVDLSGSMGGVTFRRDVGAAAAAAAAAAASGAVTTWAGGVQVPAPRAPLGA
jgi:hypothetical protein